MPAADVAADAAAFRHFNRVYTRYLGTLSEGFLRTEYSLAEGRVLYELATRSRKGAVEETQARAIADALDIDAGYLSRILSKFEKAGLLERRTSRDDSRAANLLLTPRGHAAFRTLNLRAEKQARALLQNLPALERARFIGATQTIEQVVLGKKSDHRPVTLRTHRPGDMGTVVALEGAAYVDQFGWDGTFEGMVAKIVADFIASFDPKRERCWIAEVDGRHVGHIFLVQHPQQPKTAKLRLLYVDPSARGIGVGRTLVSQCIAFARAAGYARITLWTQSILKAAHHIYQNAGFRLVREEPHHSFGKDLIGQTWELELD
ncbi:MAG TPA: helix-turn-helix domain-containing GNAT family N-acetyltransferase [Acidobacteriaceae bacterium]|jgi:DNA-binding MarR family transcriptional regulator/GNAT superfamily N-acetyltransferase|nr:helix-turn-helix domain-containing GNAT family N-acetyltransferase [Acidobacteriaceae bacterium]